MGITLIALMLLSGIPGLHGSTDIMMSLKARDMQFHPYSNKQYVATWITDKDAETEKELTDLIILLAQDYQLQNVITVLDKSYDSGWMKPIDAYKKFAGIPGKVPASGDQTRITPVVNENNEQIGWIFSRNSDIDIVHWWISDDGVVTLGITYNDLYADAVMAGEDKEIGEWN